MTPVRQNNPRATDINKLWNIIPPEILASIIILHEEGYINKLSATKVIDAYWNTSRKVWNAYHAQSA